MDDVDAGLDVGEGVGGGEDGLAFVLLVQVTVGPAVQRERRTVHERAQVIVLVKVRDALLQLVSVEEGLHVCDLQVCLGNINIHSTAQYGDHMYKTEIIWNDFVLLLTKKKKKKKKKSNMKQIAMKYISVEVLKLLKWENSLKLN